MTGLSYFGIWSLSQRKPLHPMTKDAASAAHAKGDPYVAVAEGPTRPLMYIELRLSDMYVSLNMLDDDLGESISYSYLGYDSTRLFLRKITMYTRLNGAVKLLKYIRHDRDGRLAVNVADSRGLLTKSAEGVADVSRNWERIPEFGQYGNIFRQTGEIPGLTDALAS